VTTVDIASLLEGSVAQMHCTATVLGSHMNERGGAEAQRDAQTLARSIVPEAMAEVLAEAFGSERVVVVREVSCTASAALALGAATPATLGRQVARDLTRSLARQVYGAEPGPSGGRTDVMTFASTADFVAEYLAQLVLNGSADRWYFEPFRAYHGLPAPEVVADLHRGVPELMPAVWERLQETGRLTAVLLAADETVLDAAWQASTPVRVDAWMAVARMSLDLMSALSWPVRPDLTASILAADLSASADADLVWTAGRRMASTVLDAVSLALAPLAANELPPVMPGALASWDWLDVEALAEGLQTFREGHGRTSGDDREEPLSASEQPAPRTQASTPPAAAPARPPVPTPRQTALRELVQRLLAQSDVLVVPGRPAMLAAQLWSAVVRECPDLVGQAWARGVVRVVAEQVAAQTDGARAPRSISAARTPRPGPGDGRTPNIGGRADVAQGVAEDVVGMGIWAGALVLLRSLDALRVAPRCRRSGIDPAALLRDVVALWSGAHPDDQGLLAVVRLLAGEPRDPIVDLPWLDELGGEAEPADLLALRGASFDSSRAALEELAVRVLRHWTAWLRGFSTSSIPFVLDAFVRRPGVVLRSDNGGLVVRLEPRAHDVVLELSGYLDPFRPVWPWGDTGAVLIEFVVEA
jgi:hypothetical protein